MYKIYCGLKFYRVSRIKPERNCNGNIKTYRPQERYKNTKKLQLNQFGKGIFCSFNISGDWCGKAGLYIFIRNNKKEYIGECDDLYYRVAGYGNIAPRACYKDGQTANCKINKWVIKNSKRGNIELWFHDTGKISRRKRRTLEKELIKKYNPPLNSQVQRN